MISDGVSMYALGLVYCFNVAVRLEEIPITVREKHRYRILNKHPMCAVGAIDYALLAVTFITFIYRYTR